MRPLLFVILALLMGGGCGSNAAKTTCTVDALLEADVVGQKYLDCTSAAVPVDGGFAADAMERAQQCVLDAVRQNIAFVFAYDVPHPVNHMRNGFSGVVASNKILQIRQYIYSGDDAGKAGDAHPTVSTHVCNPSGTAAALTATPGCTPAAGKPCLTCTKAGVGSIRCGGT